MNPPNQFEETALLASTIDLRVIGRCAFLASVFLLLFAWLYEKVRRRRGSSTASSLRLRDIPALRNFLALHAVLTALCCLSMEIFGRARHIYPFASPFLPFRDFWDLTVYSYRMPYLHTVDFFKPGITFPWQYPPAIALLNVPLLLTKHPPLTFGLIVTPLVCILGFETARRLTAAGMRRASAYALLLGTILLSYPLWCEMLLDNMEIFIFIFVAVGLICFLSGRDYLAAVLLGLATGIKIFPAVYFGLYLQRKRFGPILVGALTAVVSNVFGLWIICPALRYGWRQVELGLDYNKQYYMLTRLPFETGMDHSTFGFIKQGARFHFGMHMPPALLSGYMLIVVVAGLAVYFLRIWKLPLLNQIACLTVVAVLLPPTSHDYTLLHVYIPWAMTAVLAVRAAQQGFTVRGLRPAMLLYALIFSAESEVRFGGSQYSGQFKCLALWALLILVLRFPFVQVPGPHAEADIESGAHHRRLGAYSPAAAG